MVLISHRGNLYGPNPERENEPKYIHEAITKGYDVEIDVWVVEGVLFLGHDKPQYDITQDWLNKRYKHLWIHHDIMNLSENYGIIESNKKLGDILDEIINKCSATKMINIISQYESDLELYNYIGDIAYAFIKFTKFCFENQLIN